MIRVASYPDINHMARIHTACFEKGWGALEMRDLLEQAGVKGFIYDAAGSWAAFALLRIVADEAEILTIAVDLTYRRQSVGTKLLEYMLDYAKKEGVKRVFLEVAEDNFSARLLYESASFETFSTRKGYYKRWHGRAIDAICMHKSLS